MSDVVVTLSGIISVEDMKGKTADQLINLALGIWAIPKDSVDQPFVTIHNKVSNRYNPLQGTEVIGEFDPEREVLRVVLPLKTSSVDLKDEKQYLVE
jgi:hypothetical protein